MRGTPHPGNPAVEVPVVGRPAALLVLAASTISPGCGPTPEAANPRLGVICFVMFRRDALGLVKNEPISPDSYVTLGQGRLGIVGKIARVTDRWLVVVTKEDAEYWVPRETILCVIQRPDGRDFGGPFGEPEIPGPLPTAPPTAQGKTP